MTTNNVTNENRMFLDNVGLSKLIQLIKDTFSTKKETLTALYTDYSEDNDDNVVVNIIGKYADSTDDLVVKIPNATDGTPGMMSAAHFKIVENSIHEINGEDKYISVVKKSDSNTHLSIQLTQAVKTSLTKADNSIQNISTINVSQTNRPNANDGDDIVIDINNDKEVRIGLGDRTIESLNKADTALQRIRILNTDIDIDNAGLSVDDAKTALGLGTAAEANTTDIVDDNDNNNDNKLPTALAVKNYVNDYALNTNDKLIESLNSRIEADEINAGSTAQNSTAQSVFKKIVIKNGKIVPPNMTGGDHDPNDETSELYAIKISDIVDFCEMNETDIDKIVYAKDNNNA